MLFSRSSYLPHAIYSVAIISISIHLVSQRRSSSDDRARVNAQISILQSLSEQLRSDKPPSDHEFERLKRLARTPQQNSTGVVTPETIGWREVFLGPKKPNGMPEISKGERMDVDRLQKELGE